MICPFCREQACEDDNIAQEQLLKLAKAGNHAALFDIAYSYFYGIKGYKRDESEAVKWCQRAVEAGSAKAAMMLAECYQDGDGVEKDDAMRLFYLKKACEIGTEPNAFWELGAYFMDTEEVEEGMLNFRKAAICGMSDDYLFEALRFGFMNGCITKEEYAFTLRENQAAANEFKSEGREFAKMMMARCGEDQLWGQSKKQSKTKLTKAAKKYKNDHGTEPEYKRFECLYSGEETGVIRVCGDVSEVIRKADKEEYSSGLQCPKCKSEGITRRKRPPSEGKQKNKHWEVTD